MTIPGFTAEASLYRKSKNYRIFNNDSSLISVYRVTPQYTCNGNVCTCYSATAEDWDCLNMVTRCAPGTAQCQRVGLSGEACACPL